MAYNGIQQRSRDSARMSALTSLQKALSIYHIQNGSFPTHINDASSWELSTRAGGFINDLAPIMGTVPLDPINDTNSRIYYSVRAAGSYGCDVSKGAYYILRFNGFETKSGLDISEMNGCTGSGAGNQGVDATVNNAVFYGFSAS